MKQDRSEPWGLGDADDDSARYVFDVLAAVIEQSDGRRAYITNAEAAWIAKLWRVAPDLDPWAAYTMAIRYMGRERRGEPTGDLDTVIAFQEWTEEGSKRLRQVRGRE